MSIRNVFSTINFRYHGSFDSSSSKENSIMWTDFLEMDHPVERYMKILKGYVKHQYRPEASIIERYITEEAIEFYSSYMPSCEPIGVLNSRHEGKCEGKGACGVKIQSVCRKEIDQAHL